MSRYKKNFGDFGEAAAADMLEGLGYKILSRKYNTPFGEIDIIALSPDSETIVFVEVKTRRSAKYGTAAESVNRTKVSRIVNSAKQFLIDNPMELDIRFDVIEVYGSFDCANINHISNAFPDVSEFI